MTKKTMVYPPKNGGVMDAKRVRRLAQVSEHYPRHKNLFLSVYSGEAGFRDCIKACCLECNGWEPDAIRTCTATACPLWRLRPYQDGETEGAL